MVGLGAGYALEWLFAARADMMWPGRPRLRQLRMTTRCFRGNCLAPQETLGHRPARAVADGGRHPGWLSTRKDLRDIWLRPGAEPLPASPNWAGRRLLPVRIGAGASCPGEPRVP